jgi:Tfp pilus assembly protein PilF
MQFLAAPLLAFLLAAAPESPSTRNTFENAAAALSRGDLTAAETGFQAVLKQEPNNVGALGNLGVVYSRMGRASDSVTVYRRALKVAPNDPLLNLNLALAYLKQDDHRAARPLLQKVVDVQPNNTQARQLLATTQLFTGEVDAAMPQLEAMRGDPGVLYFLAIGYLKQGNKQSAAQTMQEMFAKLQPAQANFLAGRAYYESTLFEESAAALEKARDLDAEVPGVWRELGKTYISLRQSEKARTALAEAIRRAPNDPEANYFFGAFLVQEGEMSGVAHLKKARDARPEFWGSYYYLGKATNDAALLQRAAELNPNEPSIYYQLARLLKAAGRDAEARTAAGKSTELRARTAARAQEALVIK